MAFSLQNEKQQCWKQQWWLNGQSTGPEIVICNNFLTHKTLRNYYQLFYIFLCVPDQIGIWKCWFLRRGENRHTWRRTFQSTEKNLNNTLKFPHVDAGISAWTTPECKRPYTQIQASAHNWNLGKFLFSFQKVLFPWNRDNRYIFRIILVSLCKYFLYPFNILLLSH